MQVSQLEEIIKSARAALTERKRLDRLHTGYVTATNSGSRTRARTTSYNAAASNAAELAKAHEADLKRLVIGTAD
jgi:S-methylmethionine-dependent homocysteine/selenocysteine methylase